MEIIQSLFIENHTLVKFLSIAILFVVTVLLARFVKYGISKLIIKNTGDVITGDFIGRVFWIIVFVFGLLLCLEKLGLKSFSNKLLAGAGLTTFIIGFALKDIGENFLAGIVLALNKPFRVGDIIEIDNIIGEVESVTLRETTIKTKDGKDVYIPNSKLITNPLTNCTIDGFQRFSLNIEVAKPDLRIEDLLHSIKNKINEQDGVLGEKERTTEVNLLQITETNIQLLVHYWVYDSGFNIKEQQIKTNIILLLKDFFSNENIKLINIK